MKSGINSVNSYIFYNKNVLRLKINQLKLKIKLNYKILNNQ